MRTLALSLALGLLAASTAMAGDCCTMPGGCESGCCADVGCGDCGCGRQNCDCPRCPKCGSPMTCKVVCEMKEIKKTVWNVKCEPFCTTLPGCDDDCGCGRGCAGNESGCGECGCDTGCGKGECGGCGKSCDPCAVEYAKKYVPPKCGCVRSKKTLEKKEIVCKVPSYKCVAVCSGCNACCSSPCGAPGEGGAPNAAPVDKTLPPIAPAPAPAPKTALTAPLPPVLGVGYVRQ